mgnify:CR=1 FL=1
MQSILRYPGGKTRKTVKQRILAVSPKDFAEYREPFVGGGGIFFSIQPNKKRWINDKDDHLISVYQALKTRPDEFIKKCLEIRQHSKKEEVPPPIYNERLRNKFLELAFDEECDQALRYFFVNRTVWAGRVNYSIKSRLYFSNPTGWNITTSGKLEKAAKILQDAKITSQDYATLLSEPGDNVFIYCDPPYLLNSKLANNSKLYRHNFTIEDHEKLADAVKACKHRVCLSYDDDEFIRNLYKDFNIHRFEMTYCGTSSAESDASRNNKKRKGAELLICNY